MDDSAASVGSGTEQARTTSLQREVEKLRRDVQRARQEAERAALELAQEQQEVALVRRQLAREQQAHGDYDAQIKALGGERHRKCARQERRSQEERYDTEPAAQAALARLSPGQPTAWSEKA